MHLCLHPALAGEHGMAGKKDCIMLKDELPEIITGTVPGPKAAEILKKKKE